MLNIYLGKMEEAIYYPPVYFDNRYEDEWITEELSVQMIKDVDKSVVVSSRLIDSPDQYAPAGGKSGNFKRNRCGL